jgi:hypothetical protein
MKGAIDLPVQGKITHLGALGWILSTLFGYYGKGMTSDVIAHITAGMASEGFNIPLLENVMRPEGTVTPVGQGTTVAPYVPAESSWYR